MGGARMDYGQASAIINPPLTFKDTHLHTSWDELKMQICGAGMPHLV